MIKIPLQLQLEHLHTGCEFGCPGWSFRILLIPCWWFHQPPKKYAIPKVVPPFLRTFPEEDSTLPGPGPVCTSLCSPDTVLNCISVSLSGSCTILPEPLAGKHLLVKSPPLDCQPSEYITSSGYLQGLSGLGSLQSIYLCIVNPGCLQSCCCSFF